MPWQSLSKHIYAVPCIKSKWESITKLTQVGRRRGLRLLAITVLWTDWRQTDSKCRYPQTCCLTTRVFTAIQDKWHWVRSVFVRLIEGLVTNRLGICGFLFVINGNYASILHGYRDTRSQQCRSHEFDLPHHDQPPWRGGGALLRWPKRFLHSGG